MKEIVLGVEGMMCGMCESHINDAIRNKFPNIKKVSSNRKKKETIIQSEDILDKEELNKIITEVGYTMTSYDIREKKKGLFGR